MAERDFQTNEIKKPAIRLSKEAFARFFSGIDKKELVLKNYGHTLCYMTQEEKEKLDELENVGKDKIEQPRRRRRRPDAYQKALEASEGEIE